MHSASAMSKPTPTHTLAPASSDGRQLKLARCPVKFNEPLYTPASVPDGSWKQLQKARQTVLDATYRANPNRFRRGRPTAPTVPLKASIN